MATPCRAARPRGVRNEMRVKMELYLMLSANSKATLLNAKRKVSREKLALARRCSEAAYGRPWGELNLSERGRLSRRLGATERQVARNVK